MHENYNKWVALYFIAVTIVCAFLLLNMFVGIVVDEYNHHKESGITDEQRAWIETQTKALRLAPSRRVRRPAQSWRRPIFEMVEGTKFELSIMACILLNIISMAMSEFNETDGMQMAHKTVNLIFVIIFTVEAVLKLIGLGIFEYFIRNWNKFDFAIVILSLIGLSDLIGTWGSFLRVFRVARIFRLVNTNPGLRKLFKTLVFSFPYISNVAGVMGLLFFIYSVIGMNVFGTVKYGDNLHGAYGANFETFQSAMLLLFRMTTGESYNGVMHDASIQPPFCTDHTSTTGVSNCGYPEFAPIYFVSFLLFSDMLLMNILVAIILDEFGGSDEEDDFKHINDDHLEAFKAAWEEFDPQATGFMRCDQMTKLIASLEAPLGSRPSTEDLPPNSPEVVYDEDQIMKIKRDAKLIYRGLTVPTSRVIDPAQAAQASPWWRSKAPQGGKVMDCVAFHEVLSGLCGRSSHVDLEQLASLSVFTDLVARKNHMSTIRKAVKSSKRNAFCNQNGDRFTCQEVSAALLVEATWRGRNAKNMLKKKGTAISQISSGAKV